MDEQDKAINDLLNPTCHADIYLFPLYDPYGQWVICQTNTEPDGSVTEKDAWVCDDYEEAMKAIAEDNYFSARIYITCKPSNTVFEIPTE